VAEFDNEKTQEATPHRRQKARDEGHAARSQDLTSAVVLIAGVVAMLLFGGALLDTLARYVQRQLGGDAWLTADTDFLRGHWNDVMGELATTALPVMAVPMFVAIAALLMQVGVMFLPEKVKPDWSHVNPLSTFGRIFSMASVMRLTFGLFKVAVVATVAGVTLFNRRDDLLALSGLSAGQVGELLLELVLWTTLKIGVALLVLALLDYFYQRWRFEQELRMTVQEVREELKEYQGDPHVAARRRQVQRQLAQQRLKSAVPKADVVVTNPTELAVALQYVPEEMAAPVVVAKGAGVLAGRIRQLALEHGVPIVENKPLARLLFKEVDVGRAVPDQSYAAVAEVLAYVYQLKGKTIPGALRKNQT
jgi:flagellar biosynthetic protein FlhB